MYNIVFKPNPYIFNFICYNLGYFCKFKVYVHWVTATPTNKSTPQKTTSTQCPQTTFFTISQKPLFHLPSQDPSSQGDSPQWTAAAGLISMSKKKQQLLAAAKGHLKCRFPSFVRPSARYPQSGNVALFRGPWWMDPDGQMFLEIRPGNKAMLDGR